MPNTSIYVITDLAEEILREADFNRREEIDEFMTILRNYVCHLYADKDNDIHDPCLTDEDEGVESDSSDS
tara:strand:+ start:79 stop:288 length:210 start_codon:yes stop_codon:yes gene_type:complete